MGNTKISRVRDYDQLVTFNQIWMDVWQEKGYEYEFSSNTDQFLVYKDHVGVGTLELSIPGKIVDELEEVYPFTTHEELQTHIQQVGIIDKLSVLKEHRGELEVLNKMLSLILDYAESHQLRYYIALVEP